MSFYFLLLSGMEFCLARATILFGWVSEPKDLRFLW